MGDAVDRALSENHALISAILDHYSAGRSVPAVALLERLQINLEFIAAVAEHGIPLAPPVGGGMGSAGGVVVGSVRTGMHSGGAMVNEGRGERERETVIAPKLGQQDGEAAGGSVG